MTRPARRAGMTLLEVLVASTILAVFFVFVYGLVAATLNERQRIEESATPYAVGPVVLRDVVESLRCAVIEPYKDLDAFHAENETVNGETTTRIDLVAAVRSRAKIKLKDDYVPAAVNEIGYRARRSESESGLLALYRREDLAVDGEPLSGGNYYKLCDRVKSFKIDFFEKDPGDPNADDAKGDDTWDAKTKKKLPWGCRITLVLLGDVQTDDNGRPVEDAKEYTFVDYLVFPERFDKAEKTNP